MKLIELLSCVKAKCVNETETSKLAATLLAGKFFDTPSYNLDLAPCDFHLSYYLKPHLGDIHCNYNEIEKMAVIFWLLVQVPSFIEEDIQNPTVRHDSCVHKDGSLVEKYKKVGRIWK